MRFKALLFYFLSSLALAASDEYPSNWDLFLPSVFENCELSPSGRFVSMVRNVPYAPHKDLGGMALQDYMNRAYILDTQTGNMVLAGPADDPRKGQDYLDNVIATKWTPDNRLYLATLQDLMLVDPVSGKPDELRRIHGALEEAIPSLLPDSFESPMLFYETDWSRGFALLLWSYVADKNKVKRLPTGTRVKDLVVSRNLHRDRNATTIHSLTKETYMGLTYELDSKGNFHEYPFEVSPEWTFVDVSAKQLQDSERVMLRYLEEGDSVAEIKLFDYRDNRFKDGSLLVSREWVDSVNLLLRKQAIDALRNTSKSIVFSEVCDADLLTLLKQLRAAYPLCSVRAPSSQLGTDRLLIRVSSINLLPTWFIFDRTEKKLLKVLGEYNFPDDSDFGMSRFIEYNSGEERGGKGHLVYTEPTPGSKDLNELIITISGEPILDFDWSYQLSARYLATEGYHNLRIMIPWKLQLAVARATDEASLGNAFTRIQSFIKECLEVAQKDQQFSARQIDKAHYLLFSESATLIPALPTGHSPSIGSIIAIDPRLLVGRPNVPLEQIVLTSRYPFDEFFDSKRWSDWVDSYDTIACEGIVVMRRENNYHQFNASEQINQLRQFANNRDIPFAIDRFNEGEYRVLTGWKRHASRFIGCVDILKQRESNFDRIKRAR